MLPEVPDALALVLGIGLAALGGELFLRGANGLATWVRVPTRLVGVTLAAFATSAPEVAVAVNAATAGQPQIALGNALGSNVTVVALILGLTAVAGTIRTPTAEMRKDYRVALVVPLGTALLAADGTLSRLDGAVLLATFLLWLVALTRHARAGRTGEGSSSGRSARRAIATTVVGLVCLIAAGRLLVGAAGSIGAALGMDAFVVGATIIAIGTSTPELATTLVARLRGHHDIGLGLVLGSTVFNGLFIVGVIALIAPITFPWTEVAVGLGAGTLALIAARPDRTGALRCSRGLVLLALYSTYVTVLALFPGTPQ